MREEAHAGALTVRAAELTGARPQGTDLAGTSVPGAASTTAPGRLPGLSTETRRRREDTLHRAARAESAPAPTVATTMADRPRAIPPAEAPVWGRVPVAEEDLVAVVVAAGMVAVDVTSSNLR